MSEGRVKASRGRPGVRGLVIAVAMVASAALGYSAALLGWGPINNSDDRLIVLLQEQRQALDASIAGQARAVEATSLAHAQLRSERDRRDGERLVEFATRQTLERSVQEKDAELSNLREQLAFYEQLLPSGPPGTVSIRGFDLTASSTFLRYRVLLMRSGRPTGDDFKGSLQFVAEGVQDGEPRTVTLEPLVVSATEEGTPAQGDAAQGIATQGGSAQEDSTQGDAAKGGSAQRSPAQGNAAQGETAPNDPASPGVQASNTLAVEFAQYKRSQGLLALPAGFEVRTVTLNVLEGTVVRASRQITPSS